MNIYIKKIEWLRKDLYKNKEVVRETRELNPTWLYWQWFVSLYYSVNRKWAYESIYNFNIDKIFCQSKFIEAANNTHYFSK